MIYAAAYDASIQITNVASSLSMLQVSSTAGMVTPRTSCTPWRGRGVRALEHLQLPLLSPIPRLSFKQPTTTSIHELPSNRSNRSSIRSCYHYRSGSSDIDENCNNRYSTPQTSPREREARSCRQPPERVHRSKARQQSKQKTTAAGAHKQASSRTRTSPMLGTTTEYQVLQALHCVRKASLALNSI